MTNLEKMLKSHSFDEMTSIVEKATQEKINGIINSVNPICSHDMPFIINALELVALSFRSTYPEASATIDFIKSIGDDDTTIILIDLPPDGGKFER